MDVLGVLLVLTFFRNCVEIDVSEVDESASRIKADTSRSVGGAARTSMNRAEIGNEATISDRLKSKTSSCAFNITSNLWESDIVSMWTVSLVKTSPNTSGASESVARPCFRIGVPEAVCVGSLSYSRRSKRALSSPDNIDETYGNSVPISEKYVWYQSPPKNIWAFADCAIGHASVDPIRKSQIAPTVLKRTMLSPDKYPAVFY